ncbi:MAG TPA: amino acid permease [Candidatus Acidoferrales bacterium]|nr:amino acid permease [Candidatus Acidoferrales bacterium]
MGLATASAMVAGIILGTSIFVQPSEISRLVPNIPAMMAVWLLSGLLTFCGAMTCAELASAFPRTGGVYVFLKEGISPAAGFLWGWAMFWSMHSGIIAAIAVIVARYAGFFVPLDGRGVKAMAVAVILLLSGVNYLGVRQGGALQALLTAAKVLAIVLIFVFVFAQPAQNAVATAASPQPSLPGFREFLLALAAGLFAFGGWHMVTYTAGETRDPERTIPRALLLGTLVVTGCYLSLNAAYLRVLTVPQLVASERVATDAASALVGHRGAAIVALLVILSGAGSLNGIILGGPRVYFAMAQDRLAFGWLAAIHPRYRTPHAAILAQAIWSSALVATGTYRQLFTRVVYTEWLFFGLMTIGLFRLRRRASYAASYHVWGYPLVPALFVVACAAIVANQFGADPRESALGLLFVIAGLPVYYLWTRFAPPPREGDPDRAHR